MENTYFSIKNPVTEKEKRIKLGWNFPLFFTSPILGIALFLNKLYLLGVLSLAILTMPIWVVASGEYLCEANVPVSVKNLGCYPVYFSSFESVQNWREKHKEQYKQNNDGRTPIRFEGIVSLLFTYLFYFSLSVVLMLGLIFFIGIKANKLITEKHLRKGWVIVDKEADEMVRKKWRIT